MTVYDVDASAHGVSPTNTDNFPALQALLEHVANQLWGDYTRGMIRLPAGVLRLSHGLVIDDENNQIIMNSGGNSRPDGPRMDSIEIVGAKPVDSTSDEICDREPPTVLAWTDDHSFIRELVPPGDLRDFLDTRGWLDPMGRPLQLLLDRMIWARGVRQLKVQDIIFDGKSYRILDEAKLPAPLGFDYESGTPLWLSGVGGARVENSWFRDTWGGAISCNSGTNWTTIDRCVAIRTNHTAFTVTNGHHVRIERSTGFVSRNGFIDCETHEAGWPGETTLECAFLGNEYFDTDETLCSRLRLADGDFPGGTAPTGITKYTSQRADQGVHVFEGGCTSGVFQCLQGPPFSTLGRIEFAFNRVHQDSPRTRLFYLDGADVSFHDNWISIAQTAQPDPGAILSDAMGWLGGQLSRISFQRNQFVGIRRPGSTSDYRIIGDDQAIYFIRSSNPLGQLEMSDNRFSGVPGLLSVHAVGDVTFERNTCRTVDGEALEAAAAGTSGQIWFEISQPVAGGAGNLIVRDNTLLIESASKAVAFQLTAANSLDVSNNSVLLSGSGRIYAPIATKAERLFAPSLGFAQGGDALGALGRNFQGEVSANLMIDRRSIETSGFPA